MMKPVALIASVLAVTGCVETAPRQPSQAEMAVMAACDAGDAQSCQAVMAQEQQNRMAAAAMMQGIRAPIIDPSIYMQQNRYQVGSGQQQQVCPNGLIVPYPGYCPAY
jgi:hypothetical protein